MEARTVSTETLQEKAETLRGFNRFYTQFIGVLSDGMLGSPYTLSEARVIFEIGRLEETTARELRGLLKMDSGYLSRILKRLHGAGLITREPAPADRRQRLLRLSGDGYNAYRYLVTRSQEQFEGVLQKLTSEDQSRLLGSMQTILGILSPKSSSTTPFVLRPHHSGDIGWVVFRHGAVYAEEHGWNEEFEALVARIMADFLESYDPRYERSWIAERDGDRVGSVFVVRKTEEIARLRLLLVEPKARGQGLGRKLVEECVGFSRRAGYLKLQLWTQNILHSARRIYEHSGFRLVAQEKHRSFGHDLLGETWELDLTQL
jgi:DNA-binding MarR family transcriptional regulator/GNAT superfamily N-acetyltransferase